MTVRSMIQAAALSAAFLVGTAWADFTYTHDTAGWGGALTVGSGETVIIDGGQGYAWAGAVTVNEGGTLKTYGSLSLSGNVTIPAGGTLDVVDGRTFCNFTARGVTGTVIIRSGAELSLGRSDAFNYSGGFIIHVYGTLNAFTYRISADATDRIYFHDGARMIGAGDGNGAIDLFAAECRIIAEGTSVIESPIKARTTGGALNIACCENAHPYFKGGFIYGNSSNGKGNIIQVAATAAEGNPSETCANATLEIGPSTDQGLFSFCGKGIIHSVSATPSYTVESTGSEVVIAVAGPFVQTLPTITTTTAAVRLTGDGFVKLTDTAPAYPIIFDGATAVMAPGTPITLAAGSAVASDSLIGLTDPSANTPVTLFTGVDSTFDVSKLSVTAMHSGIALGTAVSPTLAGSIVMINGVAPYDASAWLEPYLRQHALLWLDASEAANFVFTDTLGKVATWKDLSDCGRDATAYTIPSHEPAWGTLGIAAGVPAYLMGDCNSGVDLLYERMTTIRTVFWVMSIRQDMKAFFLGDRSTYNFHRGNSGAYCYNNGTAIWKDGHIFCDGVEVTTDKLTTLVPTDRHVYTSVLNANAVSDRLTCDRDCDTFGRHAGRELSELIVLPENIPDADREAIEAYLAAKWMGSNPTAAATDADTYTFDGEMTVEGSTSGAKNLIFADGASIAITAPDPDHAMIATTGTVTLPPNTQLAVEIDATALPLGTYTVMDPAGVTSINRFAATAKTVPGAAATFTLTDGKLTMTITAAPTATGLTWRPQSAEDLGWNETSENWLQDDGVTLGAFQSFVKTMFDGNEAVFGAIPVEGAFMPGPLYFSGSSDYIFTGEGSLLGDNPIVLSGSGSVTMNGPNLEDQPIIISNRTLRVGNDAGEYALGTRAGLMKIVGGTLDINYNLPTNNDATRNNISHRKVIELSNGGQIINTLRPSCGAVGTLRVVDTGTIGGTVRLDIRDLGIDPDCNATTIDGDDDAVLNFNNPEAAVYNATVNIGRINVVGGKMRIEANGTHNVKNGIHVGDGAALGYWNSTSSEGATVYVDTGVAQIQAENGTGNMTAPLIIAEGATAQFAGGATLNYTGGVQNNGTILATGGTHNLMSALNEGAVLETAGGTIGLNTGFTANMVTASMAGGGFFVKDGINVDTINLTATSGSFGFMPGSGDMPQFKTYNIDTTGGAFDIRPQAAGIKNIDGTVNVNMTAGNLYAYGPNTNTEYGVAVKLIGTIPNMSIGLNSSRPGTLELKEGTDLSTPQLWTGNNGSGPCRGWVIIDPGAKVTVTSDSLRNGHWSGTPALPEVHKMHIYGELDATPAILWNTYDSPRGEVYLHEGGVLKVKGIWANRQQGDSNSTYNHQYLDGTSAGAGRHWFLMDGGRLELGSSGFGGARMPGVTRFDFQNGEIVNTSAAWGGDVGFPMFFGYEKLGGKVTFDMDQYYVNWNTGLSGASDLTIKGSVNFQGNRCDARIQGAMLGSLTVENTGANDLRVTSYFGGGLTLADGVNAEVAKYSDEHYPFAVAGWHYDALAVTQYSYPFISSDYWTFSSKQYSSNPIRRYTSVSGRGEFYVPAEKAGVWTFCGQCDDRVRLDIDDTCVMSATEHCVVVRGSIELSEGWHAFTLTQADYTGGSGPSNSGFANVMGVGFIVGASESTAPGDYTPFKPGATLGGTLSLQVRPKANACVWSYQSNNANWDITENWTTITCSDTVAPMHKHSNASDAGDWSAYFSGKVNKFEGWFKVATAQEGEWTFKMGYDDYKKLHIDGEELISNTSWTAVPTATKTLAAGWHRWSVRVGDGSGGWGPSAANNGNTLSYIAPGAEEKQFNEENLTLAATLGDIAVIEPTGIHRDLTLGESATLTSSGTMPMPIFGTLKGIGTLAGAFVFAGDESNWDVTGESADRELTRVTFENATRATFQGLSHVTATFDEKPRCSYYFLTDEITGLTAEDVEDAVVTVTDSENDYSEDFALTVKEGRLALLNRKPGGMAVILR